MADKEITEETPEGEIQYANFDDMMGSEIPDEIEETPMPSKLAVEYFEDTPEETVETETPAETPEVNVKGEELKPEEERYWQHKYDTETKTLKEQNELLRQEIDGIKTQLNPPPKEEVLVEPPVPTTDDPNDMLDYLKAKVVYDNKVHQKEMNDMKGTVKMFQDNLAQQAEVEQANQLKAYNLGKLQTLGRLTPEESVDALNMFSNPNQTEEEYFNYIADYYKFRKGKSTKPMATEGPKTPAPLAVQSGEAQVTKVDEADQFFGDMGNYIKDNY
jgi:hypothetical protein